MLPSAVDMPFSHFAHPESLGRGRIWHARPADQRSEVSAVMS